MHTQYTTVITPIGPIILGLGFDIEGIVKLTGKITAKATVSFTVKKDLK